MKCKLHKCNVSCCYNVPFENNELEIYKEHVVTPYFDTYKLGNAVLPITNAVWNKNKCPFLKNNLRCNIYDHRPERCRLMGEIDELKCNYRM